MAASDREVPPSPSRPAASSVSSVLPNSRKASGSAGSRSSDRADRGDTAIGFDRRLMCHPFSIRLATRSSSKWVGVEIERQAPNSTTWLSRSSPNTSRLADRTTPRPRFADAADEEPVHGLGVERRSRPSAIAGPTPGACFHGISPSGRARVIALAMEPGQRQISTTCEDNRFTRRPSPGSLLSKIRMSGEILHQRRSTATTGFKPLITHPAAGISAKRFQAALSGLPPPTPARPRSEVPVFPCVYRCRPDLARGGVIFVLDVGQKQRHRQQRRQ